MAQKNLTLTRSKDERVKMIEPNSDIPISTQADLLSLNRTSLYYKSSTEISQEEIEVKHKINAIYTDHPYYGSRRMAAVLEKDHGLPIYRKRVQRYMRDMGLAGIAPGPNLSKRNLAHRIYPHLLRGVRPNRPNHIWGIYITYSTPS